ncbi:MAG TPA: hypothetical protein DDW68_07955 [Verrucomicrobiales bacterium]|nr:hypothetical protein [Verrucomicrobiales bacterium]
MTSDRQKNVSNLVSNSRRAALKTQFKIILENPLDRVPVELTIHFEEQNRSSRSFAFSVLLLRETQFQFMLSRFQIGGEDHASWIIQTATETMEEVMLRELAAIDAGLNNTGIRSRENESTNGTAFEIEF